MNATTKKVAVTKCGHCGMERYGFGPVEDECPRCGRPESHQHTRWISDPHPRTVAQAEREHAGRNA